MDIVFFGTPDFARASLKKIYENKDKGFNIKAVVTGVDKKQGRGMKVKYTLVKEYALEKGLKIYQEQKVRDNEDFLNELRALKADLFVVVAYGKILPKELLEIPKYGSINVHGSLLPKYRGAAPIQWAVLNGDKKTGITTMFMDEFMDTGDMILKAETDIGENETTGELWERLQEIGASLLLETLELIKEKKDFVEKNNKDISFEEFKKLCNAQKQGDDFTVAPMIEKEIAKIDWNDSYINIHNKVRGLNPFMGAYTYHKDKKLKIIKTEKLSEEELAKIEENNKEENKENGQVVYKDKSTLIIKAKDGYIKILEIQPENSKKMDIRSFLNGYNIEINDYLN